MNKMKNPMTFKVRNPLKGGKAKRPKSILDKLQNPIKPK